MVTNDPDIEGPMTMTVEVRAQPESATPSTPERSPPVMAAGARLDAGQCACGGRGGIARRGVCWTCYEKLGEHGLAVGDDGRAAANALRGTRQVAHRLSHAPTERLAAILRALDPATRQRLAEELAKVGA